tara:strand:+ start:256 stop:525 length:270 start_codon:yes stop_codon:yes gene_type:complete
MKSQTASQKNNFIFSTSMNTTKDNEVRRKLIVLSQWLKDYNEHCYDSNEGVVESQVRMGVNTALNKIGDYLDEIMFMSNEQIDTELREK